MNPKIQKTLPVLLALASSGGVVATSYLIATKTFKHHDEIEASKNNKKAHVKTLLKCYSPALIVGTATISSIIAGTIIGKKTEASLSATCLMLDRSLRKYKSKVEETIKDKAEDIKKSLADDDYKIVKKNKEFIDKDGLRLYHEEHIGFFKADPEKFQSAITKMNERILTRECYCSLKLFLEDMEAIVCDNNIDKVSYDYGWTSDYLLETYSDDIYPGFVHVVSNAVADDIGEVVYLDISFDKEPIFGISEYKMYGGYSTKELSKIEDENDSKELLRKD